MTNKTLEMIWPTKIRNGEKVKNNLGYVETIYLIESAHDGAEYVTTSYFSRFNRKYEIHSTYFVNDKKIIRIGKWKKDLTKVLHPFSKEDMKKASMGIFGNFD